MKTYDSLIVPEQLGHEGQIIGVPFNEMYELEHWLNPKVFTRGSNIRSQVWAASALGSEQDVAVKLFSPSNRDSFNHEIEVYEALGDQEGILSLLDYGEQSIKGEYIPYIVTPLAHEGTFSSYLKSGERPCVEDIVLSVGVLAGVVRGIEAVHQNGLVYRDVKPSNVLMTEDDSGMLCDFESASEPILRSRQAVGTIGYIAPEAFEGTVIPENDTFAVGVMAYEAVTGEHPWTNHDYDLYREALERGDVPKAPRFLNPNVPSGLDRIIRNCLSPRPNDRPATRDIANAFSEARLALV